MDECTAQHLWEKERWEREEGRQRDGRVSYPLSGSRNFLEHAQICVCLCARLIVSESVALLRLEAKSLSGTVVCSVSTYFEQHVCGCVSFLSGTLRLWLTSCQYLQLECSQGGHCCSNSQQPSPWQRELQQCLPQQLWSRIMEGEVGVRKSGLQHRGLSPQHWPQGLSVCLGPSIWFVCLCQSVCGF